jgi:two-component system response regulator (stage 0 sporulation protein F)
MLLNEVAESVGVCMPKLLIVDDESDIREFARKFFLKRKIDVFVASGGRQALEIISSEKPDLILLDVRMEEMNGIEVLRELHKNGNACAKVIMVSGVEDEETIKEANALGVIGYIHKPFILEELEKLVFNQLNR